MISVQNIKKQYNNNVVLEIASLDIKHGQSIGLVGNNGAGKTTLFSLLLDLIPATDGAIYSQGSDVAKDENWKKYTSAFLDESFLIGYLTAEEYFMFVGELKGLYKQQIKEQVVQYESFFNGEILAQSKYIRDFSKGNQKKIGIVGAFLGSPKVVVLDEPFANLDPTTQYRLRELVKQKMATKELTIIISSHDLTHTFDCSHRIVVLEKGRLIKDVLTRDSSLEELESFFKI